jgi:hypothetical protein
VTAGAHSELLSVHQNGSQRIVRSAAFLTDGNQGLHAIQQQQTAVY